MSITTLPKEILRDEIGKYLSLIEFQKARSVCKTFSASFGYSATKDDITRIKELSYICVTSLVCEHICNLWTYNIKSFTIWNKINTKITYEKSVNYIICKQLRKHGHMLITSMPGNAYVGSINPLPLKYRNILSTKSLIDLFAYVLSIYSSEYYLGILGERACNIKCDVIRTYGTKILMTLNTSRICIEENMKKTSYTDIDIVCEKEMKTYVMESFDQLCDVIDNIFGMRVVHMNELAQLIMRE